MFIRNIKISNFKSFEEISVDLKRFNVLIGANASGKSNFVDVFKFLKDIVNNGLDNAISMQGGIDYIRNINIGASRNLSIELCIDSGNELIFPLTSGKDKIIGIFTSKFLYNLSISFYKKGRSYKSAEESLAIDLEFKNMEERNGKIEFEPIRKGKITFYNEKGKITCKIEGNIPEALKEWIIPPSVWKKSSGKKLFLESEFPLFLIPVDYHLKDFLRTLSIYDFDPKLSKVATQITGKTELEPDGSNLAIVLKNILENKQNAEKFSDILKDVLPFIEEVSIEKLADKSLIASLKETYSKKNFLPAFLISDGTITMTAIIIALYFEEKPFVIIEEPERNIHPYLISKVIDMMKDTSEETEGKQIIITTHNPEIVRVTDVDHLLFIHRDENGFSRISSPLEKEEVKTFLENDIGVEELYVQNLLEW